MKNKFPERLALLRGEKGVSQRQASKDLGVSQALLSHYENGIREPGLDFVLRVCEYYNAGADFVLGRTSRRHSSLSCGAPDCPSGRGNVFVDSSGFSDVWGLVYDLLGRTSNPEAENMTVNLIALELLKTFAYTRRALGVRGDGILPEPDESFRIELELCVKLCEKRLFEQLHKDSALSADDLSIAALRSEYGKRLDSLLSLASKALDFIEK